MRELQGRWKQVALAPRAQGEAMWRRFKAAQDEVFARTSAHMAAQNEERHGNLARKQALSERAEALADSTDWVRTATEIQKLQAEWKTIGPVTRGHEKAVWERFRAACDRFFTRRQEDLEAPEGRLVRKPRAQGSALRTRRGARRFDRMGFRGRRSSSSCRPSGRRSGRCASRSPKRCGSGSVRRAIASSIATSIAIRWTCRTRRRRAKRSSASSRRCLPAAAGADAPPAPENLVGDDSRRPRTLAAGAGTAAADPAGLRRALPPGARPARRHVAGGVRRQRSRSGEHAEADGEAARARRRARDGAAEGRRRRCHPTELLAQQWRERLAANTMTGSRSAAETEDAAGARRSRKSATRRRSGRGSARSRRGGRAAERAVPARLPPLLRPAAAEPRNQFAIV